MKGTLISIFVGALGGVLLTVGSNVYAAHTAASRAKHDGGDLIASPAVADAVSDPSLPRALPSDEAPPHN